MTNQKKSLNVPFPPTAPRVWVGLEVEHPWIQELVYDIEEVSSKRDKQDPADGKVGEGVHPLFAWNNPSGHFSVDI